MSKEPTRPDSVPEDAIWSPSDNEWVLAETDEDGENHGTVYYWRPDGTLVNECEFRHGTPHGHYKRFHESGEVSREGTFVDGKLHGTDVFIRSDEPTTENFPAGLPETVWRAEMDMVHNRVVAGRMYNRDGDRITEDGTPYPAVPENVPEEASYTAQTERWMAGETDEDFERHGVWRWWDVRGNPVALVTYEHGSEKERRVFTTPAEGHAAFALADDNAERAIELTQERLEEQADDWSAAGVLLDALGRAGREDERVELAKEIVERSEGKSHVWGVFTDSGRQFFETRRTALETVAGYVLDSDPNDQEIEEADRLARAAMQANHYGATSPRALLARVLLAAGRTDEAFELIFRLSDEAIAAEEKLQDVVETDAYESWLEEIDEAQREAVDIDAALGTEGSLIEELVDAVSEEREEVAQRPPVRDLRVALGDNIPPELQILCDVLDRYECPDTYRGYVFPPAVVGFQEAIDEHDGKWLQRFRTIFLPASMIRLEDEVAYIASWTPTERGDSRVYHLHQDEWRFNRSSPSVTTFLMDGIVDEYGITHEAHFPAALKQRWLAARNALREQDDERFDPWADPDDLQFRTDWLVALFLRVGPDLTSTLEHAATLDDWEQERELISRWPHLAAYWLLSHMVFGNRAELESAVELTGEIQEVAVTDLRDAAARHLAGEDVDDDWYDKAAFRGARQTALDHGFDALLSDDASAAIDEASGRFSELQTTIDETLEEIAEDDAAEKAVAFYKALVSSSPDETGFQNFMARKWATTMSHGMSLAKKIKTGDFPILAVYCIEFAQASDARWLPIVRAHLEMGAEFEETHERSVPGMITALGWLAGDYDAFAEEVAEMRFVAEDRYGRRRRMEHALVAGHYLEDSEDARDFLRDEAERWASQIDAWDHDTARRAFEILFGKGDERAVELGNEILTEARFSGANWTDCCELAIGAGNKGYEAMTPGVRRAVESKLGRIDDGNRGLVAFAYAKLAGEDAVAFLEPLYRKREEKFEANPGRYTYYHDEMIPLLSALLRVQPDNEEWRSKVREVLDEYSSESLDSRGYGGMYNLFYALHEIDADSLEAQYADDLAWFVDAVGAAEPDDLPVGLPAFLEEVTGS